MIGIEYDSSQSGVTISLTLPCLLTHSYNAHISQKLNISIRVYHIMFTFALYNVLLQKLSETTSLEKKLAKGTTEPRHRVLRLIQDLKFKAKASTSLEIFVKL